MSKTIHPAIENLFATGRPARGIYWQFGPTVVDGCTPVSAGCRYCWSAANHHRWHGQLTDKQGRWTGEISLHLDRLERVLRVNRWGIVKQTKPAVISLWNDLFHEGVPDDFISEVFKYILMTQNMGHIYILLTKRPKRMAEALAPDGCAWKYHVFTMPYPVRNLIIGTTAEDQPTANERIPVLLQIPAAVRFVSLEPLLEPVDLAGDDGGHHYFPFENEQGTITPGLDWVIIGSESINGKPGRFCDIRWIGDVVEQCQEAGVSCFVKQAPIGGKLEKMPSILGRVWDQMPDV